jgi:hypothetical protein
LLLESNVEEIAIAVVIAMLLEMRSAIYSMRGEVRTIQKALTDHEIKDDERFGSRLRGSYVIFLLLIPLLASCDYSNVRATERREAKRETVTETVVTRQGTDSNNFTETTHSREVSAEQANTANNRTASSPVAGTITGMALAWLSPGGGFTGTVGGFAEILGTLLTAFGGNKVRKKLKNRKNTNGKSD